MKRKHTVTIEFTITTDEEAFDPSNYYNLANDADAQREAADYVMSSLAFMSKSLVTVDTELVLTDDEKATLKAQGDAEDDAYRIRSNALEDLGDERDIKYTIFSMAEVPVEEMNNPLGLGSVISKIRFIQAGGGFFGDEESADYKSDDITNPTMMDAWKAFDDSIEVTRDNHHIFLEGLQPVEMDDGVLTVTFVTGS